MRILTVLIFSLLSASLAFATPINTCHCFKDRRFDPASPANVDPYLLATTQNSFLAAVFGIDKKEVVRAKMAGASGNDLWIAHFVEKLTGNNAGKLMEERKAAGSWKAVLAQQKVELSRTGSQFKAALIADNTTDAGLASCVVDQMLIDHLGVKLKSLKKLRDSGASNKKTILSAFLSLRSRQVAYKFYDAVRTGQSTWGSHLNSLGINAQDMESEIRKMVQ